MQSFFRNRPLNIDATWINGAVSISAAVSRQNLPGIFWNRGVICLSGSIWRNGHCLRRNRSFSSARIFWYLHSPNTALTGTLQTVSVMSSPERNRDNYSCLDQIQKKASVPEPFWRSTGSTQNIQQVKNQHNQHPAHPKGCVLEMQILCHIGIY